MLREIVVDTETTGLDPRAHRIVEVGCLELANHVPTGRTFQRYVNPGMPMPADAAAVHGIDDAFLKDKPAFATIADELLAFLGDAPLVIHNAEFDLGFLNAELARLGRPPLEAARAVDTVTMARRKFPGAPASLDALCKRFGVDLSERNLHGALLDARLLSEVYLELMGGRQVGLDLAAPVAALAEAAVTAGPLARAPRPHTPSATEIAAHEAFLAKLADPLWRR